MTCFTVQRWTELLIAAGVRQDPKQTFHGIESRYSEAHRAYHNARHIDECLQEFDQSRGEARNPPPLELAIWFHDAIYDPRANDNEEQSARFATECLKDASNDLARTVSNLIITTKSHVAGDLQDAPLLIDIDLSILGKSAERFAQFEAGIRDEYAWVPTDLYRLKRTEILEGFLKRERIYITESFRQRYEDGARHNLSKLIAELSRGIES
jgi:predicted metal-dependent HD superfamily phosphohydrolase